LTRLALSESGTDALEAVLRDRARKTIALANKEFW